MNERDLLTLLMMQRASNKINDLDREVRLRKQAIQDSEIEHKKLKEKISRLTALKEESDSKYDLLETSDFEGDDEFGDFSEQIAGIENERNERLEEENNVLSKNIEILEYKIRCIHLILVEEGDAEAKIAKISEVVYGAQELAAARLQLIEEYPELSHLFKR